MFPKRDLYFVEKPIVKELAKDGSNRKDFFTASGVLDSKRFANNYGGWPRSDLATINAQTDLNVAKAMAMQLETFDSNPANVGLSDQQIMMAAKSKYCQASSEQIAYYERMIAERDSRIAELKFAKEQREKKPEVIDFKDQ